MPINDRQTATVDKNTDSGKAGRVVVKTPSMDGDQYPLPIEAVMPAGLIAHPHPGDTVEIELPAGEDIVEHPQEAKYFGKRWDDSNDYPTKFKTNYPDRRGFYTPGGHYLIFDDKDKTITLESIGGITITIDDKTGLIKLAKTPHEPVVKGTKLSQAFTTYTGSIATAGATHASSPKLPADNAAFITALVTATATLAGTIATWLSTKVQTG
jgi:signal peptidase I